MIVSLIFSYLSCFRLDFNSNISDSLFLDLKTDKCTTPKDPIMPIATADMDYKSENNKRITFEVGESIKTVEFGIIDDDGNVDAEDEEFCVYLIPCSDREEIVHPSEIRVTIENDDSKYIYILY